VTRALVAALAAAILVPAAARAGPPYAAGDPDPVPLGRWEVHIASQATFDGGGFTGSAPQVEVNYGALPEVQLHVLAPLAVEEHGGGPAQYGTGDLELGAKIRLVAQRRDDVRLEIGTYPQVTLPTGTTSSGLGAGRATAFLPVWAETAAGPLRTYGGGGFRTPTANAPSGSFFFAWVVERRFGAASVGAEIFHEVAAQREGLERTGFSVGTAVDLSAMHHVLVAFGAGGRDRDLHAYLGWELAFGQARPPASPESLIER
jgi:hypothetical protein